MKKILFIFNLLLLTILLLVITSCDLAGLIGGEDESGSSPTHHAEGITFTDTDMDIGQIGGTVNIIKAIDESDISSYVFYYSIDGTNPNGTAIIELAKNGSNLNYSIPQNTNISGINYFIVRTKNSYGEMNTGISINLVDNTYPIPDNPLDVIFTLNAQEIYSWSIYNRSNKSEYSNNFINKIPWNYKKYNTFPFNQKISDNMRYHFTISDILTTKNYISQGDPQGEYLDTGNWNEAMRNNCINNNNIIINTQENNIIEYGENYSDEFSITTESNYNNGINYSAPETEITNVNNTNYTFEGCYTRYRTINDPNDYIENVAVLFDAFTFSTWNEKIYTSPPYYKINEIIVTKEELADFTNIYIDINKCFDYTISGNQMTVRMKYFNSKEEGLIFSFVIAANDSNKAYNYIID